MKSKFKPFHIFAEIKRINEEERTFDAYAFVNEVVEGEGGLRLKRSAMETATPDYMDWANIRRMHQPDAVGVAESVVWDETGANMVVKVVDEDAWQKVKNRVYKGLSVGVAATVMRGKDVEACRWYETSLVDRPKDPDAKILAFRAEGIQPGEEFEAEQIQRSFNDKIPALQKDDVVRDISAAFSAFSDCLWMCLYGEGYGMPTEKAGTVKQNAMEFCDYLMTLVDEDGGNAEALRTEFADLTERMAYPITDLARLATIEAEQATILQRAEAAETELARVQGALTERSEALATVEERVTELEKLPAGRPGPVRYPQALTRTFMANEIDGVNPEQVQALRAELATLKTEIPKEADEKVRAAGVAQFMAVQRQLNELGFDA